MDFLWLEYMFSITCVALQIQYWILVIFGIHSNKTSNMIVCVLILGPLYFSLITTTIDLWRSCLSDRKMMMITVTWTCDVVREYSSCRGNCSSSYYDRTKDCRLFTFTHGLIRGLCLSCNSSSRDSRTACRGDSSRTLGTHVRNVKRKCCSESSRHHRVENRVHRRI
jgi:hypothetical protein